MYTAGTANTATTRSTCMIVVHTHTATTGADVIIVNAIITDIAAVAEGW